MTHPVLSVLIRRPDLVLDHAVGYAALLREETMGLGDEVRRRALAWSVAVMSTTAFLVLAGVAAMLGALQDRPHWVLLAVPGAALVLAGSAWWQARRPLSPTHFKALQCQLAADAQALRRAGERA